MMVEPQPPSKGTVETDLDPRVQDEQRTILLVEELVDIIVEDKECTRVLKAD